MAKANPFRFSTKYQDDETDFLYYGYRYYNTSTGRWTSRDPVAELGGPNLYGCFNNDMENFWDFLGNSPGCCKCTPGNLLVKVALGASQSVGGGTKPVKTTIGDAKSAVEKMKKMYDDNPAIKKLCTELEEIIGDTLKAANLAEKAGIAAMQIYASTGYTFEYTVTLKYACCASTSLPEPKIREVSGMVEKENGETDFSVKSDDSMHDFAVGIDNALKDLSAKAVNDCKTLAKSKQGGQ